MAKVLEKKNEIILWTDELLFFEWKLELSDARNFHSFIGHFRFRSSSFNLDDNEKSHFDFNWWKNGETSNLWLSCAGSLRSRQSRITIFDNENSVICNVEACTNDLYPNSTNCLTVILDTPSLENFPITITGIIGNSDIIPPYQQPQSTEKHATTDESYSTYSMTCLTELSEDFKKILDSPIYSDIVVKVEDVGIKAHKMVLHARSPVFQKMLIHDTAEPAEHNINISDISAPVMKKLIAYLYTGENEKCSFEESCELYYAADKYEVLSLRDACRLELLTYLQVDNACTLFSLASRHSDKIFVKDVVQFISANFEFFVETQSFDGLSEDNLKLLMRSHARMMSK